MYNTALKRLRNDLNVKWAGLENKFLFSSRWSRRLLAPLPQLCNEMLNSKIASFGWKFQRELTQSPNMFNIELHIRFR